MSTAIRTPIAPAPPSTTQPSTVDQRADGHRNTGRIIGALFLAGFLTYGTGAVLTTSVVDPGDVVQSVSAHQTTFLLGAVLMLTVAAVEIGKAVLFFAPLGRRGRRTALAYLSAMVVEVALMAVRGIALMSIVPLGDQVQSGVTSVGVGQSLGTLAVNINDLAYQTGQATVAAGAFVLCVFLYRSRMVPRFLAMWGVIGYLVHFAGAAAELF